jgi:hypothetical protein
VRQKSRSSRKFKSILKSDPNVCVIKTRAGNWKVLKAQFRELVTLSAFIQIADRIAQVRDGFHVVIEANGFSAYRTIDGPTGPSLWTNAQMIEQHAIYDVRGKALSLEERQREGARKYGLQMYFGRAE